MPSRVFTEGIGHTNETVSATVDSSGNLVMAKDIKLPAAGGIKDSGGNAVINESGGNVSIGNVDTATIGSNALVVASDGNVGISTSAPVAPLQIDSNAAGDAPLLRLNNKNNTEVKVVETRGGNLNALNPYKAHADSNFISNEGRSGNINNQGALSEKMNNLAQHAVKHGELRILDEMTKLNKKYKVKNSGTGEETFLSEAEWNARGDRIGAQLDEASRINQLTLGDRMEAKQKARKAREADMDFETRGDDYDFGLNPDEDIPLINRNDPRYKAPKPSDYQTQLDNQAKSLPKPHTAKKPIPAELSQDLPSHTSEGLPIDDFDPLLLDDSKSKRKAPES